MTTTQNNLTDNYRPDNLIIVPDPEPPHNRPNFNEDGQPRLVNTTAPSNSIVPQGYNGAEDDYYDVSNFYNNGDAYGYYLPVLDNDSYIYIISTTLLQQGVMLNLAMTSVAVKY
jgi:hypothetical protein